MIDGDLPQKAQMLVKDWLEINYKNLAEMWESQKINKLTPLE